MSGFKTSTLRRGGSVILKSLIFLFPILVFAGKKIPLYQSGSNEITLQATTLKNKTGTAFLTSALTDLVNDTTPQLGGQIDVNGNAIGDGTRELLTFIEDASAVNHVNIENEATGSGPIISAVGDDATIALNIKAKGEGKILLNSAVKQTGVSDVVQLRLKANITQTKDIFEIKDSSNVTVFTVSNSAQVMIANGGTYEVKNANGTAREQCLYPRTTLAKEINYSILATDHCKLIYSNTAVTITWTLPEADTASNEGLIFFLAKFSTTASGVTITVQTGDSINNELNYSSEVLANKQTMRCILIDATFDYYCDQIGTLP